MEKVYLIVSCLALVGAVESASAPFITKCEWNDEKCHKDSTKAAIPTFADGYADLGISPLDPLVIESVDSSSPNLEFKLTNAKVSGLKSCKPKSIRREKDPTKIHVEFICSAELDSLYELKGQILVLSLHGQGKLTAKLNKFSIAVDIDIVEKVLKDEKKHWSVKSWSHTVKLIEKSDLDFENLLPFSKDLQTTVSELISQNSNDIIMEIGQPFMKAVVSKVIDEIRHFLKKVPIDELALS